VVERLLKFFAIDLHPLAAQENESVVARQQRADFVARKTVPIDHHIQVKIE